MMNSPVLGSYVAVVSIPRTFVPEERSTLIKKIETTRIHREMINLTLLP